MTPRRLATVCVEFGRRGEWQVSLPDRRERLSCATLDEARRLAHRCAANVHPCQVIVYDAYRRVLDRQLIDGEAAGQG